MKTITLGNSSLVALVDDEDFEKISQYNWSHTKNHALTGWSKNKTLWTMEQMVLGYREEFEIDHKDRNGLNNQKSNLRYATPSQNKANRAKLSTNTSGYKGVYFLYRKNPWRAKIVVNYENKYLGSFRTKEEAAKAYDKAAKQYFGEFAVLNFP